MCHHLSCSRFIDHCVKFECCMICSCIEHGTRIWTMHKIAFIFLVIIWKVKMFCPIISAVPTAQYWTTCPVFWCCRRVVELWRSQGAEAGGPPCEGHDGSGGLYLGFLGRTSLHHQHPHTLCGGMQVKALNHSCMCQRASHITMEQHPLDIVPQWRQGENSPKTFNRNGINASKKCNTPLNTVPIW